METELWPNTLATAKKLNVPVSIINARLSARSAARYQKLVSVGRFLSQHISHIYCLHHDDAQRFAQLGFNDTQLSVTGSLKFDIQISSAVLEQGKSLRKQFGESRPVWIAASTHQGEDDILLQAHQRVLQTMPNALMVIVPRHPERFKQVAELTQQMGLDCVRRTSEQAVTAHVQVYLGDTMGEMMTFLAASDVCFMAGSLVGDKVGGHNLLEPAALGLPTITGPSYFNFADITQQLLAVGATQVCETSQGIAEAVVSLFSDSQQRLEKGEQARLVVIRNQGAINQTLYGLFKKY